MPSLLYLRTFPKRLRLSVRSLAKLLYFRPVYFFIAAATSVVFYELIFWFLNLGLLQYLLTSRFLTFVDKIEMLMGSYSDIFAQPLSPLALSLFVVSIFQGITVAALIYIIRKERHARRVFAKELGGTGFVGALSVLGLGCAACGTSLVTPILAFFFATSSAAVADKVGLYSAWAALAVSAITTYLIGLKLAVRLEI